ncbi:MAG: glycosyltransferase [Deltaproteobacteria bacterium]|nr:glycosyltransferase [Deltaproteobacteria bacterium]
MKKILLVANPSSEHIGYHLLSAAHDLGLEVKILDLRTAWVGPRWFRSLSWYLCRKRPTGLGTFNRKILETSYAFRPDLLLSTGIAPVTSKTLRSLKTMGVVTANYLTDDPWNPKNGAGFFWESLKGFDFIFTPRRSNFQDLKNFGCEKVIYLPFAYNPRVHFYEPPKTEEEKLKYSCDLAIIGGSDEDRVPLALAAVRAGLKVKLYGGYWDRNKELRPFWKGFVYGRELRMAASGATVQLCMGRKANRDGHAMRSFELPAMGACILAEDTEDHRNFFGPEGEAVLYYNTVDSMIEKAFFVKSNIGEAKRLGNTVRLRITTSAHTYADRLRAIILETSKKCQ